MKNTWMSVKKKNLNNIFEIYYYYIYLFKIFNFLHFKNKINFYQLINFNFKISTLLKYNLLNFNKLSTFGNKKISMFCKNKFHELTNNKITNFSAVNNFFFTNKKTNIEYKLINLYFLFNYSLFNSNFKIHFNIKMFSVYNYENKLIIFDSSKFLIRWKESYDLIFNIFFYNFTPLILSPNFFKNETLALNWNYNIFDINLWKYYFPFFVFKLNNYNKKTDFFFDKISNFDVNFFFITDCIYHFKNLHYLKKKNLYSVGLVNVILDPWLVSYPIITFFESFLTQIFFFKFLIFIQKHVLLFKHNFFKNIWLLFYLNKIINIK